MADDKDKGKTPAEIKDEALKEMGVESPDKGKTGNDAVDKSAAKGKDVPGPDQQETKPAFLKSGETQDANYDEQTSDPRFPDTTRGANSGDKPRNTSVDTESHAGGITRVRGIDRS